MKDEILEDYLVEGKVDLDKIIDNFYGYVYKIVKNEISVLIRQEDMEEMISDVFLAIWKNSDKLSKTMLVKPYLAGIAKNVIKNQYKKVRLNVSLSDYEESIFDTCNLEEMTEQKEQDRRIQQTLQELKEEEYKIFILFYYEAKTIREIAKVLRLSTSNVKTILHRVRKRIKRKLEEGGYRYGK